MSQEEIVLHLTNDPRVWDLIHKRFDKHDITLMCISHNLGIAGYAGKYSI